MSLTPPFLTAIFCSSFAFLCSSRSGAIKLPRFAVGITLLTPPPSLPFLHCLFFPFLSTVAPPLSPLLNVEADLTSLVTLLFRRQNFSGDPETKTATCTSLFFPLAMLRYQMQALIVQEKRVSLFIFFSFFFLFFFPSLPFLLLLSKSRVIQG